jgi:glyoxylase-like metal-dependent hydrolase (beta-lactamase superfamily II)
MPKPTDLSFPVPTAPAPGSVTDIAPGVLWLRLPLPFALDHVNIYLIEDGPGWAVLDTGIDDARSRAMWLAALQGRLRGRPLTRLIVTHFHPDHIGLAGWLAEAHGLDLTMSQTEFLFSHHVRLPGHAGKRAAQEAFYHAGGLEGPDVTGLLGGGHAYLDMTSPLPLVFTRVAAGDTLDLSGRRFEVLTGPGHAPEQIMLLNRDENLFLAADQVLAHISPNISVWFQEPAADPLGGYLASLERLRAVVADDVLVLAAHNLPFRGLHERLDELARHHEERCERILDACVRAPHSAAELLPVVFHRPLDAHQTGFAFGEVLAHTNYLRRRGALLGVTGDDGVVRLRRR